MPLSLHELLADSTLELPKNPVIERNPELAARIEKLQQAQNERDYQAMTKNIAPGKFNKEDTVAFQSKFLIQQ